MFQLIERSGERKAVYSKDDLEYMLRRGWKPIEIPVAAILKPVIEEPFAVLKRKPGRPKGK